MTSKAPLFKLGQVVATPGALRVLERADVSPMQLIARHVTGDWGVICAEDKEANNLAVWLGGRLLSSYEVGSNEHKAIVWLITEADRSTTTALLPKEY